MRRRDFLTAAAGTSAATTFNILPSPARAAEWPEKPVRFIVAYAAGGATDLLARPWADALGRAFNQQFVVENRGGGSGIIGAEAAFKAAPDGYTFLFTGNTNTILVPLLRPHSFDVRKFVAVARMGDAINGFTMHPGLGIKTFADMIAYAKKNPGKLVYGSSGPGTAPHLRLEMLKFRTGVDILHVPYRGGSDSLQDLLAGNIHLMNEGSTLPHVRAGKLNLLNINFPTRVPDFPDVPTLTECGVPDSDLVSWFGLYGPPGLPPEIVQKLHAKISEIAATEAMKKTMQLASAVPVIQTTAELNAFWQKEWKASEDLIKVAGIKLE